MKSFIKKILISLLSNRTIEKIIDREQLFVIGTGRSGTSMFRTELWSKFEILSPPENFAVFKIIFFTEILFYLKLRNLTPYLVSYSFNLTSDHKTTWKLKTKSLINEIKKVELNKRKSEVIINTIYTLYYSKNHSNSPYLFDKTPNNSFHLDLIKLIYPNAKYIHLIRNPSDVILSYKNSDHHKLSKKSKSEIEYRWIFINKFIDDLKLKNCYKINYESFISEKDRSLFDLSNFLNVKLLSKPLNISKLDFGDLNIYNHHKNSISKNYIKIANWSLINEKFDLMHETIELAKSYGYKN